MTKWNIESMCGYKPITTFWNDFEIAEIFGKKAVIDTFKRAFKEWKSNYKYLTELVMVLNHKIHQWYMVDNDLARLYNSMWEAADKYAQETLTGEEANYFYRITD